MSTALLSKLQQRYFTGNISDKLINKAIINKDNEAILFLIKNNISNTPIDSAAESGNLQMVKCVYYHVV